MTLKWVGHAYTRYPTLDRVPADNRKGLAEITTKIYDHNYRIRNLLAQPLGSPGTSPSCLLTDMSPNHWRTCSCSQAPLVSRELHAPLKGLVHSEHSFKVVEQVAILANKVRHTAAILPFHALVQQRHLLPLSDTNHLSLFPTTPVGIIQEALGHHETSRPLSTRQGLSFCPKSRSRRRSS